MFEYGDGFLECNEVALKELEAQMSPAAVALGKEQGEELWDEEDEAQIARI
jgi:hypothetical protein